MPVIHLVSISIPIFNVNIYYIYIYDIHIILTHINFTHTHTHRYMGDVLGFNSTGGPLGFRMKFFFVTWYNLLMPGSITCPLIPGVPAKRNILQSAGYVTYIYYLVMALKAPLITYEVILPINFDETREGIAQNIKTRKKVIEKILETYLLDDFSNTTVQ